MFGERIYTRRLLLRRIKEGDLPLILTWSNSATAFGPYLTPECHCDKTLREQFAGGVLWSRHNKTLLIEKRDTGLSIGTIRYWLRQDQKDSAVISVKIAEARERGSGYGTEAQKFLIIYLFDLLGVKTVQMYTDINNMPQQRCLKKLGFSIYRALTYEDHQVIRTGYLFQLTEKNFRDNAIYRFHYE